MACRVSCWYGPANLFSAIQHRRRIRWCPARYASTSRRGVVTVPTSFNRRLRQDTAAFWSFIAREATALRRQAGFSDWTDDRLAAAIVGRWKSGAPLVRAPREDNEALGTDRLANKSFGYARAARTLALANGLTIGGGWPEAVADPLGTVCPQAAHIRKVNSRETANDMGASRASLERRILRRASLTATAYLPRPLPTR